MKAILSCRADLSLKFVPDRFGTFADQFAGIFGFIAVAMIPIPYLFYTFGKRIRARGFWSRESVYPEEREK